jgi:hypothetical protein
MYGVYPRIQTDIYSPLRKVGDARLGNWHPSTSTTDIIYILLVQSSPTDSHPLTSPGFLAPEPHRTRSVKKKGPFYRII